MCLPKAHVSCAAGIQVASDLFTPIIVTHTEIKHHPSVTYLPVLGSPESESTKATLQAAETVVLRYIQTTKLTPSQPRCSTKNRVLPGFAPAAATPEPSSTVGWPRGITDLPNEPKIA